MKVSKMYFKNILKKFINETQINKYFWENKFF